jgi:hypothetical protein
LHPGFPHVRHTSSMVPFTSAHRSRSTCSTARRCRASCPIRCRIRLISDKALILFIDYNTLMHIRVNTKKEKNSTFPYFFPTTAHKSSTFVGISTILPYGKTSVASGVAPFRWQRVGSATVADTGMGEWNLHRRAAGILSRGWREGILPPVGLPQGETCSRSGSHVRARRPHDCRRDGGGTLAGCRRRSGPEATRYATQM